MSKASKVAKNPEIDPTLPKVELKLGDENYFLCFTFGAIALAESRLRAAGISCNLLKALDISELDATRLIPLLYAALITHDPGISPETVAKLVTFKNIPDIYSGIIAAYVASLAEPTEAGSKADPTEPKA